MDLRKTVSLTTLLSFIALIITSVILYLAPQGKVAHWAGWEMMGLGKEPWAALHTNLGILFVAAGIIHTVLNRKAIVAYLKKAQKINVFTADFNIALILTLAVTLLTLLELPPVHSIQTLNTKLKDEAAVKYGDPPYGHAEISSLSTFCRRLGLPLDESIQKLKAAGLKAVSADATLADIAAANNIPPQAVYNLINITSGSQAPATGRQGSGLGRKTLEELCSEYGVETDAVIQKLAEIGIKVDSAQTIKDIADANRMTPADLNGMISAWKTP